MSLLSFICTCLSFFRPISGPHLIESILFIFILSALACDRMLRWDCGACVCCICSFVAQFKRLNEITKSITKRMVDPFHWWDCVTLDAFLRPPRQRWRPGESQVRRQSVSKRCVCRLDCHWECENGLRHTVRTKGYKVLVCCDIAHSEWHLSPFDPVATTRPNDIWFRARIELIK